VIHFSYKHLPELAHLSPQDRRIAWVNFVFAREGARGESRWLGWLIIVGSVLGVAVGAFAVPFPSEITVVVGLFVGITVPPLIYRAIALQRWRPSLRAFVSASSAPFTPFNDRAAIIAHYGRVPPKA
jgi:hypothetical protein